MRKVIVWQWQSSHLLNLSNVPDWEVHCRPLCMVWVTYTLWLYNNIYPYQGFPWRTNLSVLAHVSTNDPQDELTLRHTGRTQCLSKWINPQPYFIVSNNIYLCQLVKLLQKAFNYQFASVRRNKRPFVVVLITAIRYPVDTCTAIRWLGTSNSA